MSRRDPVVDRLVEAGAEPRTRVRDVLRWDRLDQRQAGFHEGYAFALRELKARLEIGIDPAVWVARELERQRERARHRAAAEEARRRRQAAAHAAKAGGR